MRTFITKITGLWNPYILMVFIGIAVNSFIMLKTYNHIIIYQQLNRENMEKVEFKERLEEVSQLYIKAEELDIQLGEEVMVTIQPLVDEGKYNEAINEVLEIYGDHIGVTHSGRVLVTALRMKITQGETF